MFEQSKTRGGVPLYPDIIHYADDPPRTIVTLEWNDEDVMDVWASMLRPLEKE